MRFRRFDGLLRDAVDLLVPGLCGCDDRFQHGTSRFSTGWRVLCEAVHPGAYLALASATCASAILVNSAFVADRISVKSRL